MTDKGQFRKNQFIKTQAETASSEEIDSRILALVRLLARRAARHDFAAFLAKEAARSTSTKGKRL